MKYNILIIIQAILVLNVLAAPIKGIEKYRELREKALNKERAVIFNNDGCDSYVYPKRKLPFSIEKFLSLRTKPLVGTDISTISYCTISSSFGQFTHNTKAGEFLINKHNRRGRVNVTPFFAKLKTDPLKEVIKFAHANDMEVFWSNRVNDTHDSGHRPNRPYERWSKLKQAHPEYLMGKCGQRLPNGRWSAVDFTHSEIRDLAVKYVTEVSENYAVDGIELDFFRHLYLFKSVAKGGKASLAEINMLTNMIRQIRSMTERVGMKRGRPILIAIRVPDSVEYCRALGIDLKSWLKEGLVDIIIGSGYFRLNDWKYFVDLGHKYNVKVYAGLSEPRVRNQHPILQRAKKLVYRARAAEALQAGVDGIYLFNQFSVSSPKMGYIREMGSRKKLSKTNKLHFISYRNGNPDKYFRSGKSYQNIKILTPDRAISLGSSVLTYPIYYGDIKAPESSSLIIYGRSLAPESLILSLNGTKLKFNRQSNGLLYYDVPVNILKSGKNDFSIRSLKFSGDSVSKVILKGDERLTGRKQGLWRRLFSGVPRVEKIDDGSYLLGDLGGGNNIYNFIYPWSAGKDGKSILDFKLKLKSTDSPEAVCVRLANGRNAEYLCFEPERISLKYAGKSYKMNTSNKFHDYRIVLKKSLLTVYADNKLCFQASLKTSYKNDAAVFSKASFKTSYMASNSIVIGSLSGPGKGVAYWKDIKLTSFNPTLMDVALLVVHDQDKTDISQLVETKPLTGKYPRLNSGKWHDVVSYSAGGGKLPSQPWRKHYYSGNVTVDNGSLILDHNQTGKKDYCNYEYRFDKNHKNYRFTQVTFRLKLLDGTSKPQFCLITALPTASNMIGICGLKFSREGIYSRQGRKDVLTSFPISSEFHDYRVLCDSKTGITELYIDNSPVPVLSTSGRVTPKYALGIKFGDASGSVKGKVALDKLTVNQME